MDAAQVSPPSLYHGIPKFGTAPTKKAQPWRQILAQQPDSKDVSHGVASQQVSTEEKVAQRLSEGFAFSTPESWDPNKDSDSESEPEKREIRLMNELDAKTR
jgi:hypothetical protein